METLTDKKQSFKTFKEDFYKEEQKPSNPEQEVYSVSPKLVKRMSFKPSNLSSIIPHWV